MMANDAQTPMAVARQLVAVAQADTVYAGLYRRRARDRLTAILSPAEYSRLNQIGPELARTLKESAAAMDESDLPRVRTLAANAKRLRRDKLVCTPGDPYAIAGRERA